MTVSCCGSGPATSPPGTQHFAGPNDPRRYTEVAAAAMKVLANASTELTRLQAGT